MTSWGGAGYVLYMPGENSRTQFYRDYFISEINIWIPINQPRFHGMS